jgi:N-formylmaleamate deformylase
MTLGETKFMWQDNYVELGDLRLHYWRAGSGKPLVMLHGVSDNGRCWGRTADALAKEFDVILLDQRAHGQSSAPETGYRLDDHANDVFALIDALNLQDVMLVGHSLGACVSLRTAANNPKKISRIVLIDPPMPDSPQNLDAEKRYNFFSWLRNFQSKTTEELIEYNRANAPHWSDEEIRFMAESKHQVRPVLWGENGAVLDTYWRDEMKKVGAMPVLLLYGELGLGSAISPERAAEAMSILENGESVMIERAGHIIHLDQFESSIRVILPFLRG